MTQQTEHLARALGALKTAADNELRDNRYYMAAHKITELHEVAGIWRLDSSSGLQPALTFRAALESARRSADEALADNRYYAFAHRLDALSFIAGSLSNGARLNVGQASSDTKAADNVKRVAARSAVLMKPSTPSFDQTRARPFDELAEASRKRLETVARALNKSSNSEASPENGTPLSRGAAATDAALRRPQTEDEGHAHHEQSLAQMETACAPPESHKSRERAQIPAAPGFPAASRGIGDGYGPAARPALKAESSHPVQSAPPENDPTADSARQKIGASTARDRSAPTASGGIAGLFGKLFGASRP